MIVRMISDLIRLMRHNWRLEGRHTGMVTFIIVLVIVGLIVGAIARLLMPGRDSIGIVGTIVLGIVGSFVGGFLQNLVEYHHVSVQIGRAHV